MRPNDAKFAPLGEDIWLHTGEVPGPEHILWDERRYARFMDRIYIPCTTKELTLSQIVILNRYRDSVLSSDPQFAHRAQVRRLAIDFVNAVSNGNVFEIGCGLYPLVDELSSGTRYAALEIDTSARARLQARGLDCCAEPSHLKDRMHTFDLVVALFVMQFHIPEETLSLLVSSTSSDAILLFNVATKEPAIRHMISSKLLEQGMWMSAIQAPALGNDTIFIGSKPAGVLRAIRGTIAIQSRLKS